MGNISKSEVAALAAVNARSLKSEFLRKWLRHPLPEVRAVAADELRRRGE